MFTWFKRDTDFIGYEARELSPGAYQLVVRQPDGSEQLEEFSDQRALTSRQMALHQELEEQGWTGPHGWNL
jgi:hypothetical protein